MNQNFKRVLGGLGLCGALALTMTATAQQRGDGDPRSTGGGDCTKSVYNCIDTPNPLPAARTVWLQDMTWMDVRDALALGKKTVIIGTAGIEPNGPWLVSGKHNYVLRGTCEAIALKLGDALCAPIIDYVPAGTHEPKSGYMKVLGTISVSQETYEGLIADVARSYKAHGFQNILFISDNGGANQVGIDNVTKKLNAEWKGTHAHHIKEYYQSWYASDDYVVAQGWGGKRGMDNIHDDASSTLHMIAIEPASVRWKERVRTGKATIDGLSIVDRKQAQARGWELINLRADITVEAIKATLAAKK